MNAKHTRAEVCLGIALALAPIERRLEAKGERHEQSFTIDRGSIPDSKFGRLRDSSENRNGAV